MFEFDPAIFISMVLGALFALLLIVAVLQYLWNATMPEVFGVNRLTFGHAFRLLLISVIPFGGLGAGLGL